MIDPWRNGYLESGALCPLDNPVLQRDSARDLAVVLADRNDAALKLHHPRPGFVTPSGVRTGDWCACCCHSYPCQTVKALTGADESEVA